VFGANVKNLRILHPGQWIIEDIRAVLAAVIPAIQAEALERAAVVLKEHEAGYAAARARYQKARDADMTAFVGAKETAIGVALVAIRALKEGT